MGKIRLTCTSLLAKGGWLIRVARALVFGRIFWQLLGTIFYNFGDFLVPTYGHAVHRSAVSIEFRPVFFEACLLALLKNFCFVSAYLTFILSCDGLFKK